MPTSKTPSLFQGGIRFQDGTLQTTASTGGASITASNVQQETYTYAADTGAVNAFVVTLISVPTLVAGSVVQFKAANGNTGACTLNVNATGAVSVTKNGTSALASGDISTGQIVTVIYDGVRWQVQGLETASAGGSVTSVFGRTGAVVATTGDYTVGQVTNAASQAGVQQDSYIYAADTGSANAYAVSLTPTPTLTTGSTVVFKAANTNTGASTLNLNSLGAKNIFKDGGIALVGREILSGAIVTVVYDGTQFQLQGGEQPAMVKIAETILGSSAATISFSSIPQTFRNLKLMVTGGTDDANPDFYIQFNADTGTNYSSVGGFVGQTSGNLTNYNTAKAAIGSVGENTAPANQAGVSDINIFDYARTTWKKSCTGYVTRLDATTTGFVVFYGVTWLSTAAITSLVIGKATGSGNFVTGTVATLYGII